MGRTLQHDQSKIIELITQNKTLKHHTFVYNHSHSQDATKSQSSVKKQKEASTDVSKNGLAYQCLLKNELLGAEIEDINEYRQSDERKAFTPLVNRNVFRVSLLRIL